MKDVSVRTIEWNILPRLAWSAVGTGGPLERHMRVRLCSRCPYTPSDLADHYDPGAVAHACAKCDGEQDKVKMYYPRESNRRRKCAISPNISMQPQRNAAPCAAANSVSSGTIPGGLHSVQRSALVAPSFVGRATAAGSERLKSPDSARGNGPSGLSLLPAFREKEPAQ
jgi:hypothetical protein